MSSSVPKTFAKDITDSLSINKKRGYPAYAMDPDLLTETQRERYLEDPRLIERKSFQSMGDLVYQILKNIIEGGKDKGSVGKWFYQKLGPEPNGLKILDRIYSGCLS